MGRCINSKVKVVRMGNLFFALYSFLKKPFTPRVKGFLQVLLFLWQRVVGWKLLFSAGLPAKLPGYRKSGKSSMPRGFRYSRRINRKRCRAATDRAQIP